MNKNELSRSYDSLHDGVNSSTSDQHTDHNEKGMTFLKHASKKVLIETLLLMY